MSHIPKPNHRYIRTSQYETALSYSTDFSLYHILYRENITRMILTMRCIMYIPYYVKLLEITYYKNNVKLNFLEFTAYFFNVIFIARALI